MEKGVLRGSIHLHLFLCTLKIILILLSFEEFTFSSQQNPQCCRLAENHQIPHSESQETVLHVTLPLVFLFRIRKCSVD